jgi:hypothetical protein
MACLKKMIFKNMQYIQCGLPTENKFVRIIIVHFWLLEYYKVPFEMFCQQEMNLFRTSLPKLNR